MAEGTRGAPGAEEAPSLPPPGDEAGPGDGSALCLSGGGYRAMMFHVGALWRLYEGGWLARLDRISSVSGSSITAGVLALGWSALEPGAAPVRERFERVVVDPLRRLAGRTVDVGSVLKGLLLPGSAGEQVAGACRKYLFGAATLQDLPDHPHFVLSATSVHSGAPWRFSRPRMGDHEAGEVRSPTVSIARAVAASSAFPPFLSPLVLELDPDAFMPGRGDPLRRPPRTRRVALTDGGVCDQLGLGPAWRHCRTVLVSDGGRQLVPEDRPARDWARHARRVLEVAESQVRSLRKRRLIGSYLEPTGAPGGRVGAYWGIRTDIADYGLADPLPCPRERTLELAATPTRLARLPDRRQERLVNWGYAVCDAALRRHLEPALPRGAFPYPEAGV